MSGWELVRERARLGDTAVALAAVLMSAACLIPLFVDLQWVLPAVTIAVVISALGAASRGLGMPVPLVPIVQALGLILTVTALFAATEAWGRLVPTPQAWDVLRALLQDGLLDSQALMAPVPTLPGLVLLAAGGVGLVALSTDTLFVSVRSPLLAGLPLLALFLAAALIPQGGAPWWAFPLPAAGWLLILAADQRDQVRAWGRLPSTTRVRGLSTAARRTGLVAIVLASVIALVLPTRGSMPWGSGGPGTGSGAGSGSSATDASVILDPLVSMRRSLLQASDVEVLTYQTQAENPSYLRVSVLETFDGTTWLPREGLESGRDRGVPIPGNVLSDFVAVNDSNRVRGGASYTYDIRVRSLENAYLPLPYPVSQIDDLKGLDEDWRLDPSTGVAFSDEMPATGTAYRVAALDPLIQSAELRNAQVADGDFWPQLNLPGGMSPRIRELAREVTATAETPYDKAIALQRWFTRDGGFTYSTGVRSGSDADYLAEFLDERIGYCEQFAATMAVMARSLGIPSRVVVGFTQGSLGEDGTWRVTVRDAHAWPELWFEGVGWARFEPTPRSSATVLTPEYARSAEGDIPGGAADDLNLANREGFDAGAVDGSSGLSVPLLPIALLGVLAALLLLALPMTRRVVRRRRRLHARDFAAVVDGAWAEVGDLAIDHGQPWSEFATPRQAAERLGRGMGVPASEALRRLRQEVEQVRYAPRGAASGTSERAEAIRADVQVVARELRNRVRWQTRLAAYCWPSSDRRRQRSSMRSMKPGVRSGPDAAGFAGAAASPAGREPKAE
jgi:transglutaminase-like putative cysteine protease